MKIIFETDRLLLRELNISDAENFYKLNSDFDVIKFTGDNKFTSVNEAKTFLENYTEYKKYGYGRWAVLSKSDDKFLGWCGLKYNEEQLVDLGFRFFKKYWGNGFATEAAKGCLDYGFSELHLETIVGRALKKNTASIKVLEKIGMTFWKEALCHGNEECVYYRIESQILNNN